MAKRLRVRLLPNWADGSRDNPGGPATFYRTDSEVSGALQLSLLTEYVGGQVPNPTGGELIELAQGHGEHYEAGELVQTGSGACHLGTFGTAIFRSDEYPRIQFWYLSNGRDFVLATHVCTVEPDNVEVAEAQQI